MKHPHAEWIKRWADGEELEYYSAQGYWTDMDYFFEHWSWQDCPNYLHFRVKPKEDIRYYEAVYHSDGVITFHSCDEKRSNFSITLVNNKVINVEYTK